MVLMVWMIFSSHGMFLGKHCFHYIYRNECEIADVFLKRARSTKSNLKLALWATWKSEGAPKPRGFPARLVGGLVVSSTHAGSWTIIKHLNKTVFHTYMCKKYWEYCIATEKNKGLKGEWILDLHSSLHSTLMNTSAASLQLYMLISNS